MTNCEYDKIISLLVQRLDRMEEKLDVMLQRASIHEGQLNAYRPVAIWLSSIIGSILTAYIVTKWIY